MKRYASIWSLTLLAALLAGCTGGASSVKPPEVKPIAVTVAEARQGSIAATHTASGQVEPVMSVTVTAKISGRVQRVHRQMGDPVRTGDLLVELERSDAEALLSQAMAALAQAEAQLQEARRQSERASELFRSGAISRQSSEQAQTQLSLAEARLQSAQASTDLARTQLEHTRVVAPAAGVLASRSAEVGALIGPGTPLFQVADLSTAVVRTGLPERYVNAVAAGTRVTLMVSALGRALEGTVEAVSPVMDRQTRSYQVRVTVPNPDGALKGGMFAQAEFAVGVREGILVPIEAVLERNGEQIVFVVAGNEARQQRVKVLEQSRDLAAVEGIGAGDQVVVSGQNRLYEKAPVRIGRGGTQ